LLRNDPQLIQLFGLGGGSPFLSESGLDGRVGLFAQLLGLCKRSAIIRFLDIVAFLFRFDLCNRGDPAR
jgi:hypothetical protein